MLWHESDKGGKWLLQHHGNGVLFLGGVRRVVRCRAVESELVLWALAAEDLLAANDVGLIPWVTLTHFEGPPEQLLRTCRERIDRQAPPGERANLPAVTQVMTQLVHNNPGLLAILGGSQVMLDSPLIQEISPKDGTKTF